jgi:glutathione S-transferase
MKLYDYKYAPNPRRVRLYLFEKGLIGGERDVVEVVPVDLPGGEHRSDAFRAKNPMGGLPVLELDDGRCFPESLAIIEYFEELFPKPTMIGTTPEERLRVRGLERRCELGVMMWAAQAVWNTSPFFASRIEQNELAAKNAMRLLHGTLKVIDASMADAPFIAGEAVTIADCTLFASLSFAKAMGVEIDLSRRPALSGWYDRFRARPSAKA